MKEKRQRIFLTQLEDDLYEVKKLFNFKAKVEIGEKYSWVELQGWLNSEYVDVVIN